MRKLKEKSQRFYYRVQLAYYKWKLRRLIEKARKDSERFGKKMRKTLEEIQSVSLEESQ